MYDLNMTANQWSALVILILGHVDGMGDRVLELTDVPGPIAVAEKHVSNLIRPGNLALVLPCPWPPLRRKERDCTSSIISDRRSLRLGSVMESIVRR